MKFLVVDDEKDVELLFRQKFRKEIKDEKVEMIFAFSGQEALQVLKSNDPPDVVYVFSDINMPGMTGLELLDEIKSEYPGIAVSMISAYGDQENYNKAIESGAKDFFTKPIDFQSLRLEINQMIDAGGTGPEKQTT
jgi:two-component system, response regulator, stage 0 sporulation protein F